MSGTICAILFFDKYVNSTFFMESPKIHFKTISAETTHLVRHPVLRPGMAIESCILPGDELKSTIHLGAYDQNTLLGVCTILDNPKVGRFMVPNGQIRGMAVLSSTQNSGVGRLLLTEVENRAKSRGFEVIWMNARKGASGFYLKMGYRIEGSEFEVPVFGPHYVIKKQLL
jgi:ribosomal protein S18 acetylase RimI-like enzyme